MRRFFHRSFVAVVAGVLPLAACAHVPAGSPAPANALQCDGGEPYLDIVNLSNGPIDVYAYANNVQDSFIGTAGPSETRLSLVGTPLEHVSGYAYAVPTGAPSNSVAVNDTRRSVILTRKCDRSKA